MSFFSSIGSFFSKLFKSDWQKTASTSLAVIGPLASTVVTLTLGADAGAESTKVVAIIQKDLATLNAAVQAGTATPTLPGIISDIQTNLSGLLDLASIKNSDKRTQITSVVNLIGGELTAIAGVLPTATK